MKPLPPVMRIFMGATSRRQWEDSQVPDSKFPANRASSAAVPDLPNTTSKNPPIPRFNVLGVSVSAMNLSIAVAAILEAARARQKGYICVTGVHGVIEAGKDPDFRRILNSAFLN